MVGTDSGCKASKTVRVRRVQNVNLLETGGEDHRTIARWLRVREVETRPEVDHAKIQPYHMLDEINRLPDEVARV